jgi:hypothetical protein
MATILLVFGVLPPEPWQAAPTVPLRSVSQLKVHSGLGNHRHVCHYSSTLHKLKFKETKDK